MARTPETARIAPVAPASPAPLSPLIVPGVIRAADLIAILLGGVVATLFMSDDLILQYKLVCVIAVAIIYSVFAEKAQLFSIGAIMRPVRRADDIVVAAVTAFLFFFSVVFALDTSDKFSRAWSFTFLGAAIVALIVGRMLAQRAAHSLSRRGVIGRNTVVLGVGEQGRRFLRRFREADPDFTRLAGVFHADDDEAPAVVEGLTVRGGVAALLAAARAGEIDDVVVAMPWNADRRLTGLIEQLKELPINVYLSSDLIGFELAFRPAMGSFKELPLFEVLRRPISGWSSALKIVEDYTLATILLIFASPLMLFISLMIKIDSRGPVFFMQERLGFNNAVFYIYKFRSMHHGPTPETTVRQATKGDPRVTRIGRIIRATSLDELPQLLNVLNGTMSLVGPRPHAISHNEEYGSQIRGYFARHKVKPGITGWAQVNGLRGETETIDKMEARIRHDVYYAENWSILFDLRILLMTGLVVVFQKTAY